MPEFSEFENVAFGSFDEVESCSPEVDDDFRGLVIAAPKNLPIQEEMIFPLCGTYQVDEIMFIRFGSFENEIVAVVTDLATNQPYQSSFLDDRFQPDVLENFEPDEGVENVVITGWYNADLYTLMPALPKHPGRYQVFVTIGEMKSNVVDIEIIKPWKHPGLASKNTITHKSIFRIQSR